MSDVPALRIIDAALNRAGEGLRVVEDFVRFVLDDTFLTAEAKSLRHDLKSAGATISRANRHAARDTICDVGTSISAAGEQARADAWAVCAASLKRAEQALRSLEEYGKLFDAPFAERMEKLRYGLYTLEKAIDVGRASRERFAAVSLCVLIDGCATTEAFKRLIVELVGAGVGMIQLRDKRMDDRRLTKRARLLVTLTRRQPPAPPGVSASPSQYSANAPAEPAAVGSALSSTLAIINDRADVAAAVQADGVHLGQEDLSVKDARAIVGPRMLIGVSTHNLAQARAAVSDGANYLGAGPTFASQTKSFERLAGLDYLREVAAETRLPIFAIGGITPDNLPEVLATGITRVAAGAAITSAEKPNLVARRMLGILNAASQS